MKGEWIDPFPIPSRFATRRRRATVSGMNSVTRFKVVTALVIAAVVVGCLAACSAKEAPAPRDTKALQPSPRSKPLLDFIELNTRPVSDEGAAEPLVVAVHGLGDRPENLADLYRDIAAPCRLVLPRAPLRYGRGSSWFDIDIPYRPDPALAGRIADAADRVVVLMHHLVKTGAVRGKPIITGFSQGGMISFAIAVRHPESIALSVPLAGALPPEAWPAAEPVNGVKPVVRAFHGASDDLVHVDYARRTVEALRKAGYDASLDEYPGVGHAISPEMRRDALRAIAASM
jgi:phospholipase/carboxylesterase